MTNKYTGLIKAAVGSLSGIFSYINDVRLDSYAYFSGDKNIDNLKKKLELQKIEYKNLLESPKNKYKYMDSAIIAGLTLPEMLKKGVSEDVQLAYQLAFSNKVNDISFTDAWASFNTPDERIGFVNTIKGKLFEIKYVDHLNATLEPGYTAAIAGKANQPGWDIQITGPDQEVINQIQLKASSSIDYVKSHFDKYPDIDVITIEDLKGQIGLSEKISFAAISNEELQAEIIAATPANYEFLPSVLAMGYVVLSSYTKDELSWYEKNVELGRKGTGVAVDLTILGSLGLLGIIPILVKKSVLNSGNQKRRYVEILENQLISQRRSIDIWKKKLSRRDFIKGLALTATATKFAIKKV